MESVPEKRKMRLARNKSTGNLVLAVIPALENSELATFPKPEGIKADSIISFPNGSQQNQNLEFRKSHFNKTHGKDPAEEFADFALAIALYFKIKKVSLRIEEIDERTRSVFSA